MDTTLAFLFLRPLKSAIFNGKIIEVRFMETKFEFFVTLRDEAPNFEIKQRKCASMYGSIKIGG